MIQNLFRCTWGEILHQSRSDSVHWISISDVIASTFVTHTTGVLRGVFCDAQKLCIHKNRGVHVISEYQNKSMLCNT